MRGSSICCSDSDVAYLEIQWALHPITNLAKILVRAALSDVTGRSLLIWIFGSVSGIIFSDYSILAGQIMSTIILFCPHLKMCSCCFPVNCFTCNNIFLLHMFYVGLWLYCSILWSQFHLNKMSPYKMRSVLPSNLNHPQIWSWIVVVRLLHELWSNLILLV